MQAIMHEPGMWLKEQDYYDNIKTKHYITHSSNEGDEARVCNVCVKQNHVNAVALMITHCKKKKIGACAGQAIRCTHKPSNWVCLPHLI